MTTQHYIFLSPHFDDVALSCGGLVWDLTCNGHTAEVWTIMGGIPPQQVHTPFAQEMHHHWGMPADEIVQTRRTEDQTACQVMGAKPHHFDWLDAIYRMDTATGEPLVINNETLFGKVPETEIIHQITQMIREQVPKGAKLVSPISLGDHIDHRAVRQAAELSGRVDFYYADYPYILYALNDPLLWKQTIIQVPHLLDESALNKWQGAVLSYKSQLSMFWRDEQEARLALRNYFVGGGGRLWLKN